MWLIYIYVILYYTILYPGRPQQPLCAEVQGGLGSGHAPQRGGSASKEQPIFVTGRVDKLWNRQSAPRLQADLARAKWIIRIFLGQFLQRARKRGAGEGVGSQSDRAPCPTIPWALSHWLIIEGESPRRFGTLWVGE